MVRRNGKSDVDSPELDVDRELAAAAEEDAGAQAEANDAGVAPEVVRGGEFDKLKAERDMLVDRLARLQAEFENARKRSLKEQQDFREYALADAVKELLPTLDSFERALQQTSAGDKSEFRGGVELIYKQLQDALVKLGPSVPAGVSPSIRIFIRRLKWSTPATPGIIVTDERSAI
jgi:molecular chaperone GrpE